MSRYLFAEHCETIRTMHELWRAGDADEFERVLLRYGAVFGLSTMLEGQNATLMDKDFLRRVHEIKQQWSAECARHAADKHKVLHAMRKYGRTGLDIVIEQATPLDQEFLLGIQSVGFSLCCPGTHPEFEALDADGELVNRCQVCFRDLGSANPRQLCGKTTCAERYCALCHRSVTSLISSSLTPSV